MKTRGPLLLAMVSLFAPAHGSAQVVQSDVVDRLVAIVGDSVVVQTQIQEEIQRMALGGNPAPEPTDPEYEPLFRSVLDQFVDRLLILQAASKDSLITVDDEAIEERVSERITQLGQQFGGQAALQQALAAEALTLAEYREILRNEARIERIQQLFMQLRVRDATPAAVTEDEMLARFQEARGQLEQRPKLLTFRQVVMAPESSDEAVEAARVQAQNLLDSIKGGADFEALAREFSDDPGTAPLGGELGWFRRGRMVREFEDAAFGIFEGLVDDLVHTDFGFHIIRNERYRAGERFSRHILIVPAKSEADIDRARTAANAVLQRAQSGESMKDLFDEFADPAAPDSLTVPFEQLGELPPAYASLRTASTGDFVGPFEYEVGPGETRITIVRVIEVREAGAYTFDDLRGQIASQLQQEKQVARVLEGLRATTYIEIRM